MDFRQKKIFLASGIDISGRGSRQLARGRGFLQKGPRSGKVHAAAVPPRAPCASTQNARSGIMLAPPGAERVSRLSGGSARALASDGGDARREPIPVKRSGAGPDALAPPAQANQHRTDETPPHPSARSISTMANGRLRASVGSVAYHCTKRSWRLPAGGGCASRRLRRCRCDLVELGQVSAQRHGRVRVHRKIQSSYALLQHKAKNPSWQVVTSEAFGN